MTEKKLNQDFKTVRKCTVLDNCWNL